MGYDDDAGYGAKPRRMSMPQPNTLATLSAISTLLFVSFMRDNGTIKNQEDTVDSAVLEDNYAIFRDCLADLLLQLLDPTTSTTSTTKKAKRAPKARKSQIKPVERPVEDTRKNDAEDLADFIEYIAFELWPCLPLDLRTLNYAAIRNDEALSAKYAPPLPLSTLEEVAAVVPPSVFDSLAAYSLFPSTAHDSNNDDEARSPANDVLFLPLLTAYTTPLTTPPPSVVLPSLPAQRSSSCELCARDWIPLTYHHLIPRSMHAKAIKRGWHQEWELANVAWLCRACHSFVHRVASNEELAREWYTVERLEEREDVQRFAAWIGSVRWKKR